MRFNVSDSSSQHRHNCEERNLEVNRMETEEQKTVRILPSDFFVGMRLFRQRHRKRREEKNCETNSYAMFSFNSNHLLAINLPT